MARTIAEVQADNFAIFADAVGDDERAAQIIDAVMERGYCLTLLGDDGNETLVRRPRLRSIK